MREKNWRERETERDRERERGVRQKQRERGRETEDERQRTRSRARQRETVFIGEVCSTFTNNSGMAGAFRLHLILKFNFSREN